MTWTPRLCMILSLPAVLTAALACTSATAKSKPSKTDKPAATAAPADIAVTKKVATTDITVPEAAKLVEENKAYLVDVRERDEIIDEGMAKPAKWLAMEEIQVRGTRYEDAIRTWPTEMPLIFYCASGKRAGIAAGHFKELGYTTSVMGRFKDWTAAGLPTRPKP